MKKTLVILSLIAIFISIFNSITIADNLKGRFGIGLGYPYLSLKYGVSSKFTLEARGASGDGIQVLGGRLLFNFNPRNTVVLYLGIERDNITFDTEGISGKGQLMLLFLGGEYFIKKDLTVSMDMGPGVIGLTDSKYSDVNVNGTEWILNIGVNFYF